MTVNDWIVRRQWQIDEHKITLIQKNDELMYDVFNTDTAAHQRRLVALSANDPTIDKITAISNFIFTHEVIIEHGLPTFVRPCHQWSCQDKTLSLLRKGERLIWQIFDKTIESGKQIDFEESTHMFVGSFDAIKLHKTLARRALKKREEKGENFYWNIRTFTALSHYRIPDTPSLSLKDYEHFGYMPYKGEYYYPLGEQFLKNHPYFEDIDNCIHYLKTCNVKLMRSYISYSDKINVYVDQSFKKSDSHELHDMGMRTDSLKILRRRWDYQGSHIDLLQHQYGLSYSRDSAVNETRYGEIIELPDDEPEIIPTFVDQFEAILDGGKVTFVVPTLKWLFNDYEIHLLCYQNQLIWQLCDKISGYARQLDFKDATYFLNTQFLHASIKDVVTQYFKQLSPKRQSEYDYKDDLKAFRLFCGEKTRSAKAKKQRARAEALLKAFSVDSDDETTTNTSVGDRDPFKLDDDFSCIKKELERRKTYVEALSKAFSNVSDEVDNTHVENNVVSQEDLFWKEYVPLKDSYITGIEYFNDPDIWITFLAACKLKPIMRGDQFDGICLEVDADYEKKLRFTTPPASDTILPPVDTPQTLIDAMPITLEMSSAPINSIASLLNENKMITSEKWAVTLIDSGVSESKNCFTWGGHAAIIIEGISDGKYFMKKVHLVANFKDKTRALILITEVIDFKGQHVSKKSKTWLKNKNLIEKMLEKAEEERDKLEKAFNNHQPTPIGFSPFAEGIEKKGVIKHSCISWARKMFEILRIKLFDPVDLGSQIRSVFIPMTPYSLAECNTRENRKELKKLMKIK